MSRGKKYVMSLLLIVAASLDHAVHLDIVAIPVAFLSLLILIDILKKEIGI